MEIKAKAKFIRMSPRKIRLVVNLIRGLTVAEALDQLRFINKRAVKPVEKLLKSAVANARHNFELNQDNLYIKEIKADQGPVLHRWLPRAHGRATPIRKKGSHISIVISEIEASGKIKAKKLEMAAPIKLDHKPKGQTEIKTKAEKDEEDDKIILPEDRREKGQEVVNLGREGRIGHTKVEGGRRERGFVSRIFRRKSG